MTMHVGNTLETLLSFQCYINLLWIKSTNVESKSMKNMLPIKRLPRTSPYKRKLPAKSLLCHISKSHVFLYSFCLIVTNKYAVYVGCASWVRIHGSHPNGC